MSQETGIKWYTAAGVIGLLFGAFYSLVGLEGLPVYHQLVSPASMGPWKNGLYGAVFIGFSILMMLLGRHAFAKGDKQLMKILLYGLCGWLIVEAGFSIIYGVYLNVGIDLAIMAVLGLPLIQGTRAK